MTTRYRIRGRRAGRRALYRGVRGYAVALGAALAAVALALAVGSAWAATAVATAAAAGVRVSPAGTASPSAPPATPAAGIRTGGSPAAPDRGRPGWVWFGVAGLALVFGAGGFRVWQHWESAVPEEGSSRAED